LSSKKIKLYDVYQHRFLLDAPHKNNEWEKKPVNTSSLRANADADPVLSSAMSRVKRHILPLFVIMFIVNYIDRVNIGFVRTGMVHDLGIGAAASHV
jgi:hypothetical protein